MARKFLEDRLVIGSHNTGKVREMVELMAPYKIALVSAEALGLDEPEETEPTFIGNAEIKSRAAAAAAKLPAFADDSGIVVPALDGQPGVYSARWSGPKRDFSLAIARIERELEKHGVTPEGAPAYFVSALSICWTDGHVENFEGKINGTLTFPPRGENGFGYDPIFVPAGYDITFGEMVPEDKHAISHRARSFEKLVAACFSPDV